MYNYSTMNSKSLVLGLIGLVILGLLVYFGMQMVAAPSSEERLLESPMPSFNGPSDVPHTEGPNSPPPGSIE